MSIILIVVTLFERINKTTHLDIFSMLFISVKFISYTKCLKKSVAQHDFPPMLMLYSFYLKIMMERVHSSERIMLTKIVNSSLGITKGNFLLLQSYYDFVQIDWENWMCNEKIMYNYIHTYIKLKSGWMGSRCN